MKKLKLQESLQRIRTSFWFLPSLMVAGAIALAFTNLYLDRTRAILGEGPTPWLAAAGAEAARSLLSTIAGSMITVAGVTFSIVIVALSLASSQFGPRLLVGFMADTGNQIVLGTFISVFVYCLVVLLHLPGDAGSRLLPQMSILTGVVLAVVAVGVLIFFFHHISNAMQAGELVLEAGNILTESIRQTLPEEASTAEDPWPPNGFSMANARFCASRCGYLSALDVDRLTEIAADNNLRIMVEPLAGDFVLQDQTLALISPPEALTDAVAQSIRETFSLVHRREDSKDLPLAVERLAEIAVRGLSPGINDPYTALAAIHRLSAGLDGLLERLPVSSEYRDRDGTARVFLRFPEAEDFLNLAYGQIRTYGRGDVRIVAALMESVVALSRRRRKRWDAVLLVQAKRIVETAGFSLDLDADRALIEACYDQARTALNADS